MGNIRWISDQNRNPNNLAYYIQLKLRYFYGINVISKLIWDSISIGNPPIIKYDTKFPAG